MWQINPLPNLPVPLGIGHMVARWLAMRVGVSNLNLHGRVRFAMAPLMSRLPVVGGVKVSAVHVLLPLLCGIEISMLFFPLPPFQAQDFLCGDPLAKLDRSFPMVVMRRSLHWLTQSRVQRQLLHVLSKEASRASGCFTGQ